MLRISNNLGSLNIASNSLKSDFSITIDLIKAHQTFNLGLANDHGEPRMLKIETISTKEGSGMNSVPVITMEVSVFSPDLEVMERFSISLKMYESFDLKTLEI